LLYVGDCHATQGDGDLSGVAIEQRANVTPQAIEYRSFARPELETENVLMTIGSARPQEDALRITDREPVHGMSAGYGFDEINATTLLSPAGRIRPRNMIDSKVTMGASVFKKISGFMMHRQQRGGVLQ